jgi:hypothetical protein
MLEQAEQVQSTCPSSAQCTGLACPQGQMVIEMMKKTFTETASVSPRQQPTRRKRLA